MVLMFPIIKLFSLSFLVKSIFWDNYFYLSDTKDVETGIRRIKKQKLNNLKDCLSKHSTLNN